MGFGGKNAHVHKRDPCAICGVPRFDTYFYGRVCQDYLHAIRRLVKHQSWKRLDDQQREAVKADILGKRKLQEEHVDIEVKKQAKPLARHLSPFLLKALLHREPEAFSIAGLG